MVLKREGAAAVAGVWEMAGVATVVEAMGKMICVQMKAGLRIVNTERQRVYTALWLASANEKRRADTGLSLCILNRMQSGQLGASVLKLGHRNLPHCRRTRE